MSRHIWPSDFNPRPPRGGRPMMLYPYFVTTCHFNPRPPRGGRLLVLLYGIYKLLISIHAPREGGDYKHHAVSNNTATFQSTPPARGATGLFDGDEPSCGFQSTPPARGATHTGRRIEREPAYFNPRPPRGGRRSCLWSSHRHTLHFNPRPPRGGRRWAATAARGAS